MTDTKAEPTALGDPALISSSRRFDRGDLAYLACLLLPFSLFLQLGRALGWLEMIVRPRSRRAVRANLEHAFGATKSPREIAKLTRQVFEFHDMRILMVLVAPLLVVRGKLEKHFPLRHIENLDRAIAEGKGVIIIGSHVNSIGGLLAVIRLRQLGYDVRSPMPDPHDAWPPTPFRRFIHGMFGASTVSELLGAFYAQFNVRPLMRVLKQRAALMMIGDGWHSAGFVDVDFLGRRLPFTSGPMNVARLAGVPVVPFFSVGQPHRMHFEFEPHFTVEQGGQQHDDVERGVRYFIGRVEQRMLADIPSWEHWMVEDVFGSLESWRNRPIHERYAV